MADLSPTPANVIKGAGAKVNNNREMAAGVTGTAGQAIYLDSDGDIRPSHRVLILEDRVNRLECTRPG